jgi:hypothetical protein
MHIPLTPEETARHYKLLRITGMQKEMQQNADN